MSAIGWHDFLLASALLLAMTACASAQEADPLNVSLHIGFDGSPAANVPAELSTSELEPVAYVDGFFG